MDTKVEISLSDRNAWRKFNAWRDLACAGNEGVYCYFGRMYSSQEGIFWTDGALDPKGIARDMSMKDFKASMLWMINAIDTTTTLVVVPVTSDHDRMAQIRHEDQKQQKLGNYRYRDGIADQAYATGPVLYVRR